MRPLLRLRWGVKTTTRLVAGTAETAIDSDQASLAYPVGHEAPEVGDPVYWTARRRPGVNGHAGRLLSSGPVRHASPLPVLAEARGGAG